MLRYSFTLWNVPARHSCRASRAQEVGPVGSDARFRGLPDVVFDGRVAVGHAPAEFGEGHGWVRIDAGKVVHQTSFLAMWKV